jgi:Glucose dehydrogenase C-terminus
MKAIAVFPDKADSVHLADLPKPSLDTIPNGRGVLVKVLRVGVDGTDRTVEVPADKINLQFVLGNKVMVGTVNANREYFELGVRDMAQAEAEYPGWFSRLLTHPVKGLDNYRELLDKLTSAKGAIKVYCEVADVA